MDAPLVLASAPGARPVDDDLTIAQGAAEDATVGDVVRTSTSSPTRPKKRRWVRRVIIGGAVVVVLAVAIPFGYIHFVNKNAPAKLTLTPTKTTGGGSAQGGSVSGTWTAGRGSVVGYRVDETLVGQRTTAVGRTSSVSGRLVVTDTAVTAGSFTAQMATVTSNEHARDEQFDGRIMDVARYPTATFTLTRAIVLGHVPAVGTVHTYRATGNLMLRGQTHPVSFAISAERTGTTLQVQGEIPILFATWDVPNPSFGSFVQTADHGTLEFLLDMTRGKVAS